MPEVNPVSMSNTEHIEHTFYPKTCLCLDTVFDVYSLPPKHAVARITRRARACGVLRGLTRQ